MISHKEIEDYILSMPNSTREYPFGEGVAVYKAESESGLGEGKMFALITEGKLPVQLSLKCDPQLAQLLRDKYIEVMPGYHLNKKHWNTMLVSGQLSLEEVQALILHSYNLVTGTDALVPGVG